MLHLQQTLIDKLTKEQLIEVINEQAKTIEDEKFARENVRQEWKKELEKAQSLEGKVEKLKQDYSRSQKRVATLFNYVEQLHQATAKGTPYILENVDRIIFDEAENISKKNLTRRYKK